MDKKVFVLLVTPPDQRWELIEHLVTVNVSSVSVCSLRELRRVLDERPMPPVVLTAVSLPDGNWLGVLREVIQNGSSSEILVYSDTEDEELRCNVRSYGAYDLIAPPFEGNKLKCVVEEAALSNYLHPRAAVTGL